MSLHNLANELQKKGRGKDQMLVHMTPKEVAGLQAIAKAHGGSLTVNPDTGLVEAGFLNNILPSLLPMAAGAALTIGSGGALSPLAAAMITGTGYGLATGSVEKGLTAGLGAYGGAGLAGSLSTAGANIAASPEAIAGQLGTPAATGPGSQAALLAEQNAGFGVEGLQGISNAAATATPTPAIPQFDGSVIPQGPAMGAQAPMPTYAQQVQAGAQDQFGTAGKATDFLGQNYGKVGMAAAPTLAAAMEPEPYQEPEKKKYTSKYNLSPDFQGYVPRRPDPYYRPTGLGYAMGGQIPQLDNMAPGGLAALQGMRDGYDAPQTATGDMPQFNGTSTSIVSKPKKATLTGARNIANMDAYEAAMAELNNSRYGANMSQLSMPKAGLAGLGDLPYAMGGSIGGYSDGGRMLRGPGDGMSDSIPASINGKQPARLADGEFVVPADVVSHLGNGSTDAGAKKLYSMMDKIRQARTGKKKQAPAVKASKYMPA